MGRSRAGFELIEHRGEAEQVDGQLFLREGDPGLAAGWWRAE